MIKPMAQVVLEGPRAIGNLVLDGPGGRVVHKGDWTVEELTKQIAADGGRLLPWSLGLAPVGLPLRALYHQNGKLVFLVEYPPGLRTIPWILKKSKAPFGPKAQYGQVTIALPYVIFFVTVTWDGIFCVCSVYFRTEPLKRSDYGDALLDCHFLNCSVGVVGVYCWVCCFQDTPYQCVARQSLLEFVAAHIENFWFSAFNLSSEVHEGQSFFRKGSAGRHAISDKRVRSIDAWECASRENPDFALQVPWNASERTVLDVFNELTSARPWPFRDASALMNLILTNGLKSDAERKTHEC